MPAGTSLWLVTAPADSRSDEQLKDLQSSLGMGKLGNAVAITFPELKTGTLSSLITLSETLAKQDPAVTSALSKVVDSIRMLTSPPQTVSPDTVDRSSPLSQHLVIDDGRPYLEYIFPPGGSKDGGAWEWNRSKYRTDNRSLSEVCDALFKEVSSIENAQRNKSSQYGIVKGQLTAAQRKKTGNLSMRSLAEVVSPDDFSGTKDSEYLETVLVAVPKNLTKDWDSKYERLTQMVVPRSSSKVAQDDEFVLYGVAIFKRVKDDFSQKCRENKFIVRDFSYNQEAIEKQAKDLESLQSQDQELWTDLLRLSRINFSELFQILVHLKVVRAFIESVLRYGLPASYFAAVIKPEPKASSKLLKAVSEYMSSAMPSSNGTKANKSKKKNKSSGDDGGDNGPSGEYATVLEGEYLDFVLFEIEKIEDKSGAN